MCQTEVTVSMKKSLPPRNSVLWQCVKPRCFVRKTVDFRSGFLISQFPTSLLHVFTDAERLLDRTSHLTLSLIMQRERIHCTCCNHPLHASAANIGFYGQRSYTFHLHIGKNSSIGFKNGECGGRNSAGWATTLWNRWLYKGYHCMCSGNAS